MPTLQYVTIVAQGGTPIRIADQTGAPIPTTGTGALVFSVDPDLTFTSDQVLTWLGETAGGVGSVLTSNGPGQLPSWEYVVAPVTFSQKTINFVSSGNNTVIAAISGRIIKIYGMVFTIAGVPSAIAGPTSTFKSNTTELAGPQTLGSLFLPRDTQPYYTCGVGESFIINISSALQCGGTLWYTQETA